MYIYYVVKWYYFLLFISVFYTPRVFAQGEANIWYFGEKAGLDFNSGKPVSITEGRLNTREGCSSVSDKDGNLLFYTDGVTVYNKNHAVMSNGSNLNGHDSSTHSALIVPKPDHPSIYFIFTTDARAGSQGLQYSEVDMTLDGGLGRITTEKNIILYTPTTEQVAAIKSPVLNEYWIVSHKVDSNEFVAFNLSKAGVNTVPVISAVGDAPVMTNDENEVLLKPSGQMKISPDGKKIAVARTEVTKALQLFDFDASSGVVSNPITLLSLLNYENAFGVEFSPNSKLLYARIGRIPHVVDGNTVNIGQSIFQFNLYAATQQEIVDSKIEIAKIPNETLIGAMQLGPDCKIYMAALDKGFISSIDAPNTIGSDCNFIENAVFLKNSISKIGMPSFESSLFLGFEAEHVCLGVPTKFNVDLSHQTYDSLLWDFKDGNTSTEINPTHIYNEAGVYNVELATVIGTEVTRRYKRVEVYQQPIANRPKDIFLFNDSGFNTFDLSAQNASVLNGQDASLFSVIYYAGIEDFNNNIPIQDFTGYKNKRPYIKETIIASVVSLEDESCFDTTLFNIQVLDRFPNYFTPNNDGFHDFWQVKVTEDDLFAVSKIQIYNRYGKMIKILHPSSKGWNGNFNGNPLPESDYWFLVELINKEDGSIRIERGHFSLVR